MKSNRRDWRISIRSSISLGDLRFVAMQFIWGIPDWALPVLDLNGGERISGEVGQSPSFLLEAVLEQKNQANFLSSLPSAERVRRGAACMQLTVELPDEQARELGLDSEGLEQLVTRVVKHLPRLAYVEELVNFLGQDPTPEEIVAFHASDKAQERVRGLLEKNREGRLTTEEEAELDTVEKLNQLFALVKARAWEHLPRRESHSDALLKLARERANNRCEYCLIPEAYLVRHEVDHIVAVQDRGPTIAENLALACFDCNRMKRPNLSSIDPITGSVAELFHPRRENWSAHFRLEGARIMGETPTGRATTELPEFNNGLRLRVRQELQRVKRYPVVLI
jgi:hypothetical protein